jgi:hypothetical protein
VSWTAPMSVRKTTLFFYQDVPMVTRHRAVGVPSRTAPGVRLPVS